MQSRINYGKAPPGAMKAMQAVQQYVNASGLEPQQGGQGVPSPLDDPAFDLHPFLSAERVEIARTAQVRVKGKR